MLTIPAVVAEQIKADRGGIAVEAEAAAGVLTGTCGLVGAVGKKIKGTSGRDEFLSLGIAIAIENSNRNGLVSFQTEERVPQPIAARGEVDRAVFEDKLSGIRRRTRVDIDQLRRGLTISDAVELIALR